MNLKSAIYRKEDSIEVFLKVRFRAKVYRFQRQDDGDTIFGKASDFSYTTVKNLIDRGRKETDERFKSSPFSPL